MAYRIEYNAIAVKLPPKKRSGRWRVLLAVAALVGGAALIKRFALDFTLQYLIPGDPAVTAAAFENMAQELKLGQSLTQALTTFCREIIANAGVG